MIRRDAMPGSAGQELTRKVIRGFDPGVFQDERMSKPDTYRHAAGMPEISVADLARLSGISATAIYGWEKGTRSPQANLLRAVAEVLVIPMEKLIVIPESSRTLADLRWLAGMTQPEAAAALGVSTQSFGRIERGELALTDERAEQLAALYARDQAKTTAIDVAEVRAAWQRAKNRPAGAPA
ncbi:helix-turn-helix transcriptional regulator [Nocardia salmonicida]|uniref:helix-turn-helix transcriptional regulator n=1 Tax=Nocardia salmonicida TaxID=53431 RepID=UPI0033E8B8D3